MCRVTWCGPSGRHVQAAPGGHAAAHWQGAGLLALSGATAIFIFWYIPMSFCLLFGCIFYSVTSTRNGCHECHAMAAVIAGQS
mmetsp:Transcript_24249/g.53001  ORF Transcript_24249/g.53001 Transcript_24249/m.53001 type:complete len:83 (-) Transcript_24249:112-360(-)